MFQKIWKMLLRRLKWLTEVDYCRVCNNEIKYKSISKLLNGKLYLCKHCLCEMKPNFRNIKLNNLVGMGIFLYEDNIKDLIYTYKGCFDKALAPIFLNHYLFIIKIIYFNYIFVPVPSYYLDDEERGFNHIEEILFSLDIPYIKVFDKVKNIKQSNLNFNERMKQENVFCENENINKLDNKNICLVDDVLTTGKTLTSLYQILRKYNVRKIKFLVISYTKR